MSAIPHTADPARLEAIVGRIQEIAVLPHVVFKVLEISGSEDSPALEMERVILVDPGFSSKLLTQANSAYYGLPKKASSIKEAIMFLGFKAVRHLAMTVGVYDMFVGKTDAESLRRRAWWRHSVDTAVVAKWLSNQVPTVSADEAYTAGLLHWIGKPLLDRFGGEDYGKVTFLQENGVDVFRAETAVFGCDHTLVGHAAGTKWRFPEPLLAGFCYNTQSTIQDAFAAHRALVAIASAIAGYAQDNGPTERQLPTWAMLQLSFDPDSSEAWINEGLQVIADAAQAS